MRDEAVEQAAERLTAIYSKCLKLSQEWFPETVNDKLAQRITILALMKDMVEMVKTEALPTPETPEAEAKPEPEPIDYQKPKEEAVVWKPHKSGGGEWTYSSDLPKLKLELAAGQGRYSDRDYNYTLSDDGRFISRWAKKK